MPEEASPPPSSFQPIDSATGTVVEAASVAKTAQAATKTTGPKKFRWSYEILDQQLNDKGETELVYPFLNDNNDEDYLFLASLLAHHPWAAKYGKKDVTWKALVAELAGQRDRNGKYPFATVAVSTLQNRFSKHKSLEQQWLDKTGAKTREEAEEDDTLYDDNDRGHRSYSQIIRDGVLSVIEQASKDEENKEKEKEAELQKEHAEQGQVEILKAAALGRLKETLSGVTIPAAVEGAASSRPTSPPGCRTGTTVSVLSSGDNTTTSDAVPSSTRKGKGSKGGSKGSGGDTSNDKGNKHGIEELQSIAKSLEERKKHRTELQVKHEDRKLAEAANEKLRLENEKRDQELRADLQKQQMSLMEMMMAKLSKTNNNEN